MAFGKGVVVIQTYCIIVRRFSIEPRDNIVKMKEEAVFGVERIVMLFYLHRRRAEVGRKDVNVDVPVNGPSIWGEMIGPTTKHSVTNSMEGTA